MKVYPLEQETCWPSVLPNLRKIIPLCSTTAAKTCVYAMELSEAKELTWSKHHICKRVILFVSSQNLLSSMQTWFKMYCNCHVYRPWCKSLFLSLQSWQCYLQREFLFRSTAVSNVYLKNKLFPIQNESISVLQSVDHLILNSNGLEGIWVIHDQTVERF